MRQNRAGRGICSSGDHERPDPGANRWRRPQSIAGGPEMALLLDRQYAREYAPGSVVLAAQLEGGKTGGFEQPISVFMRPCAPAHPLFLQHWEHPSVSRSRPRNDETEGVNGKLWGAPEFNRGG